MIVSRPDEWRFYQQYLKSALALIDSNWSPTNQNDSDSAIQADHTVDMVLDFIDELAAADAETSSGKSHTPSRGVSLARMELLRILKERGSQDVERTGEDLKSDPQTWTILPPFFFPSVFTHVVFNPHLHWITI